MSMCSDTNKEKIAFKLFEHIINILEEYDNIEIEEERNKIEILVQNTKNFFLNYHYSTQQIWLSSPLSGAHHFILQDNSWLSTRSNTDLLTMLSDELKILLNVKVDFRK